MSPLTRAGYPNNRNIDKPFKRVQPDKNGKWTAPALLSKALGNGCMGYKSRFGIRVKAYGPQTGRKNAGKKPKNRCRLVSTDHLMNVAENRLESVISLRAQLHTVRVIESWTNQELLKGEIKHMAQKIFDHIRSSVSPERMAKLYQQDEAREKSIIGRLNHEGVNTVRVAKIIDRLKQTIEAFRL